MLSILEGEEFLGCFGPSVPKTADTTWNKQRQIQKMNAIHGETMCQILPVQRAPSHTPATTWENLQPWGKDRRHVTWLIFPPRSPPPLPPRRKGLWHHWRPRQALRHFGVLRLRRLCGAACGRPQLSPARARVTAAVAHDRAWAKPEPLRQAIEGIPTVHGRREVLLERSGARATPPLSELQPIRRRGGATSWTRGHNKKPLSSRLLERPLEVAVFSTPGPGVKQSSTWGTWGFAQDQVPTSTRRT